MKNHAIEQRLREMKNNRFQYNGVEYLIKDYQLVERLIRVKTDKEDIRIFKEDAEMLNTHFKPVMIHEQVTTVKETNPYLPQARPQTTTVIGQNATKLADILMANIQKVQEDKEYIPQAAEINSQVKSIIDLAKAEVEMLKVVAGLR